MSSGESTLAVETVSLGNYVYAAEVLGNLASSAFGIEISEDTKKNWEEGCIVMRLADTVVDESAPVVRDAALDYLQNVFAPRGTAIEPSVFENTHLAVAAQSLRARLTDKQAAEYFRKGMQIVRIGNKQKNSHTTKEFAKHTRVEGQLAGSLILALTNEDDRQHPRYKEFVWSMRRMSRVSNAVDSAADLKRDYAAGLAQIKPSVANRAYVLASSTPDVIDTSRTLGRHIFKLTRAAYVTIEGYRKRTEAETELIEDVIPSLALGP